MHALFHPISRPVTSISLHPRHRQAQQHSPHHSFIPCQLSQLSQLSNKQPTTAEAVVTAEEEEQEVLVVVAAAGRVVEGAVVLSHDHLERRFFGPVLEEVLMLALAEAVMA